MMLTSDSGFYSARERIQFTYSFLVMKKRLETKKSIKIFILNVTKIQEPARVRDRRGRKFCHSDDFHHV